MSSTTTTDFLNLFEVLHDNSNKVIDNSIEFVVVNAHQLIEFICSTFERIKYCVEISVDRKESVFYCFEDDLIAAFPLFTYLIFVVVVIRWIYFNNSNNKGNLPVIPLTTVKEISAKPAVSFAVRKFEDNVRSSSPASQVSRALTIRNNFNALNNSVLKSIRKTPVAVGLSNYESRVLSPPPPTSSTVYDTPMVTGTAAPTSPTSDSKTSGTGVLPLHIPATPSEVSPSDTFSPVPINSALNKHNM